MANLTEINQWDAGIYKIETTDKVLGGDGVDDVSNRQAKQLANRSLYLKSTIETGDPFLATSLRAHAFDPAGWVQRDLYSSGELMVLHGCIVSGTNPKSITAGAIYYNGKVYKVSAATVASGTSWVFGVKSSTQTPELELKSGASGSGIADWNSSLVWLHKPLRKYSLAFNGNGANGVNLNSVQSSVNALRDGENVKINLAVRFQVVSAAIGFRYEWDAMPDFLKVDSSFYSASFQIIGSDGTVRSGSDLGAMGNTANGWVFLTDNEINLNFASDSALPNVEYWGLITVEGKAKNKVKAN